MTDTGTAAADGRDPGARAREFLDMFNELEDHLRAEAVSAGVLDIGGYKGASQLARELHKHRRLHDDEYEAIDAFVDLRNALAHNRYRNGRPIADPLPETIDSLRQLVDQLRDPMTLGAVIAGGPVVTLGADMTLADLLTVLDEQPHRQFPVYDGGTCIAMLTTDAIARWAARDISDGAIDATTVADILGHVKGWTRPVFIPRDMTVRTAIRKLTGGKDPRTPGALIATENGKPTQQPVFLVTLADLPALYAATTVPMP